MKFVFFVLAGMLITGTNIQANDVSCNDCVKKDLSGSQAGTVGVVKKINGLRGEINISGDNGVSVTTQGNTIIVNASSAVETNSKQDDILNQLLHRISTIEDRINEIDKETINGLVAHYPFSGDASDITGNGNDGFVNGATLSHDRFGVPNEAYLFDGLDDYIEVNDNDMLDGSNELTISMWFNINDAKYYNALLSKRKSAIGSNPFNYSYGIFIGDFNNLFIDINYFDDRFSIGKIIEPNLWYHIVVIYRGDIIATDRVQVFLDGELVKVGDESSSAIPNYPSNLVIGKLIGNDGTYFSGMIDDLRIYNRAISEIEINDLYVE